MVTGSAEGFITFRSKGFERTMLSFILGFYGGEFLIIFFVPYLFQKIQRVKTSHRVKNKPTYF
jgi:hypothetical protein